ncbi:MAG: S49 family peptidase, partial [Thiohalospira sp.]
MSDENPQGEGNRQAGQWERDVLNRLAFASLNEQRRARRWGIFFKALILAYLIAVLYLVLPGGDGLETPATGGSHTAVVDVPGVITDDSRASADIVTRGVEAALEDPGTEGVILRINSPGGSPVQAGYLFDDIQRLRKEHEKTPIHAVITDIGASGGYYVAAAADKVYANRSSIVGSIGVTMSSFSPSSFGFDEAIERMGIERRLLTAGEDKDLMDPFRPLVDEDADHMQTVLDDMHEQFITAVKEGRGDRLKTDGETPLFSGLVWTGERGVELGLVDDLASPAQVAREEIGAETMVDFTPRERYLDRLM